MQMKIDQRIEIDPWRRTEEKHKYIGGKMKILLISVQKFYAPVNNGET